MVSIDMEKKKHEQRMLGDQLGNCYVYLLEPVCLRLLLTLSGELVDIEHFTVVTKLFQE